MQPTQAQTADSPPAFWDGASLQELYKKRRHVLTEIESYKSLLSQVDEAISRQLNVPLLYKNAGKLSGDMTTQVGNLKFKTKIDKRVKWNSDSLFSVARTMPWERVTELFKLEFSMGERVYNDLSSAAGTDPEARRILEGVTDAREVVYGEPKIVSVEEV